MTKRTVFCKSGLQAITVAGLLLMAVACASITPIQGSQVLNGRLQLQLSDTWNKLLVPGSKQPFEVWTQDGLTLDQLRVWPGLQDGQALVLLPIGSVPAGQKAPRLPTYHANMRLDQLVNLFERIYAADGSIVTLTKLEPALFAGEKGVHFEFSMTRKSDEVQLLGMGWASQIQGELFAATFVAPRLGFFPRLLPLAERVISTARVVKVGG